MVSESGAGFTWSLDSQLNRLTPWSNDPVCDPPGEVVYLRDEETGEVWCPTPLPVADAEPTLVRHGQGYTIFERDSHGLRSELVLCVPPDDPVKLIRLRMHNHGDRPRRLSATYYVELALGQDRDTAAMHVVTEIDAETGALFARNAYRTDFSDRIAVVDVGRRARVVTADRCEFLGRHGSVAAPAVLARASLSGWTGAAHDPCAAIQVVFDLEAGGETEIVFILGEASGIKAARELVLRYRDRSRVTTVLQEVRELWDRRLQAVQVRTPDPALDLLFNYWLLYQVQSCRVWARSAFYQSGGAYGFRDQLQDVMALARRARGDAAAHCAGGGATVHRRRRAALVASAGRPRRAHQDLRRSALASTGDKPLFRRHGGCIDPR